MDFSFENQGASTYLVYSIAKDDAIDTMALGMLTNNRINGITPTVFSQMDTERFIKFNVSAKITAKQFFEGAVNRKRLLGVLNGIVDAMMSVDDYMIDPDTILLDLEYIYTDVSTFETELICLPILGKNKNPSPGMFFKQIIFNTCFDQSENCDYVTAIINYLNSTTAFSLVEFKNVLNNLASGGTKPASKPAPVDAPTTGAVQEKPKKEQPKPSQPGPGQNHHGVGPQPVHPRPPVQPPVPPVPTAVPKAPEGYDNQPKGKTMSMLDLLMHYSKENKAIYDAQKAQKKAGKQQPMVQVIGKQPRQKGQNKKASSAGFAVPGMENQVGGSVSGRPVQAPARPAVRQEQPQSVTHQQPKQPSVNDFPPIDFGPSILGATGSGDSSGIYDQTTVVPPTKPHLIRLKNNEKVNISKQVFRIGKEKSYVDYFIGDNSAISRSHANIINRDGDYYIVDTNSTNHTYVNDEMIQSGTETKLQHGAKIRLANEDFEFRLY